MNRIGLAIGAAGVLVVSGLGAGVASGGSPYDSVSGAIKRTGLSDAQERHFIVSAHDGPNGATGHYKATYGKGASRQEYEGRVTCVSASGNQANVGILVTRSTRPGVTAGYSHLIRVIDNGNPGDGAPSDVISPGVEGQAAADCNKPFAFTQDTHITGNVLVKDAGS